MNFLALFIKPLDNDVEADEVVRLLSQTKIGDAWLIERPTEETNAIIITVVDEESPAVERWETREKKLESHFARASKLLRSIDEETIGAIKAMGLEVFMRVHTPKDFIFLPAGFVCECGRLGLEIRVYNERAFS